MNRALEPSPDPTGESIRARDLSALDEPLHEDALAEMSRLEEAAGDPESRSGALRPDAVLAVVDASYRAFGRRLRGRHKRWTSKRPYGAKHVTGADSRAEGSPKVA